METSNNNLPDGRDIAQKHGYPVMDPMEIRAVGVYPSSLGDDINNPPLPNLDPNSLVDDSKKAIPALSVRIK